MRELDEAAPPAFVNGDASHGQRPQRAQPRVPKPAGRAAAPRSPAAAAPAEEALPFAWPDRLGAVLELHDDWRQRMALLAQEQLSFMAETGGELLTAEPDPARRLELVWTQAMRQMERSLTVSSRLLELLAGAGGGASSGTPRRRPG